MKFARKSISFISACFLTASIVMPLSAAAGTPAKIRAAETFAVQEPSPRQDAEIVPGEVIVKYRDGSVRKGVSASGFQSPGFPGVSKLRLKSGEDVYAKIEELKADPNVEYAQPVYVYRAAESGPAGSVSGPTVTASVYRPDDPYYPEQWGLYAVGAEDAWAEVPVSERQETVVAVVDTGVRTDHEDLVGNFYEQNGQIVGANFAQDHKPSNDFYDYNGHGTHVAGIIGATANNGKGVAGIASGVKIMPVRVLDANGLGDSESVAEGIKFAADHGADVINLSLASEGTDRLLEDAVQYALDAGVVVVAATGNESNNFSSSDPYDLGYDPERVSSPDQIYRHPVDYPAAIDGVIAVGAVGWFDTDRDSAIGKSELQLADFSNTGNEADVVAPGLNIRSTYNGSVSDYKNESGTSMATPFVSGLSALILAHDRYVNGLSGRNRGEEVQRILADSSYDLGAPGKDNDFGSGLVSAGSALTMSRIFMDWSAADNGDVTLSMDVRDKTGVIVTDSVYSVALSVYLATDSGYTPIHQDTLTRDVSSGKFTKTYSDLTVPGVYWFKADDSGDRNDLIYSDLTLENPPAAPTASLRSGTYTGTQTVTLTSSSKGAKIRYTLDGTDPTLSGTLYTGPISIGKSLTLKAVSIQNGSYSGISAYTYTINPAVVSGGGGGGGGGFFLPPSDGKEQSTDPDGKSTLTVTVDTNEALKEIDSGSAAEVVVDALSDTDTDKLSVEMSGEILRKAADRNKSIRIRSNQVTITIRPGTVKVSDPNAAVKLTAEKLGQGQGHATELPPSQQLVSGPYDFQLTVGGNRMTDFDQPLTITIHKLASAKDREKLGVYCYNPQTGAWDYVGGYAKAADAITFGASHFSTYAVLESNRTFADIQNHWARHDIEVMAARQVAQGRGPDTFDPNGTIGRAEFAALITRALSIEKGGQAPFADVPAGAWYTDSVNKAYAAGIISGTSGNTFSPNAPITREALATMLLNAYAYSAKVDLSTLVTTQEVKYTDEGSVSPWARGNVRLANALGLMVGTDGMFMPKANATRAEAISILKRLIDKLNA